MRNTRRDLTLMVVPVLILAGIGFALRNRRPAVLIPPQPFRLTLDKVHFEPVTPYEASEGYDTKVVADLGHRGTPPIWWGQQTGISGMTSGPWQLLAPQGNVSTSARDTKGAPVPIFRWQAAYDKDKGIYSARYLMKLRQIPSDGELRLQDRLGVESSNGMTKLLCAPVWVNIVVRKQGQSTASPQVSHETGLKIERLEFDAAPPTTIQNAAPQWRVRFLVRSVGASSNENIASSNLQVVDQNGADVSTRYTSSSSNQAWSDVFSSGSHDTHLTMVAYSFGLDLQNRLATMPLRLKGTIYSGDHWPLQIDVPLRDMHGKMLVTPRSAPLFRVASVRKGIPDADQASGLGADTLITVKLQAIGTPPKPMQQWDWETNYECYVMDAKGKRYWTFPFKGGSSSTSVSGTSWGSASAMFSYVLNLAKIPLSDGALTFHSTISANGSQRVPVEVRVR